MPASSDVSDRIRKQVPQHLLDPPPIGEDRRGRALDTYLDVGKFRHVRQRLSNISCDLAKIEGFADKDELYVRLRVRASACLRPSRTSLLPLAARSRAPRATPR